MELSVSLWGKREITDIPWHHYYQREQIKDKLHKTTLSDKSSLSLAHDVHSLCPKPQT